MFKKSLYRVSLLCTRAFLHKTPSPTQQVIIFYSKESFNLFKNNFSTFYNIIYTCFLGNLGIFAQ